MNLLYSSYLLSDTRLCLKRIHSYEIIKNKGLKITFRKNKHDRSGIRVAVINVNSIWSKAKAGAFKAYIMTNNPDIIIANETGITGDC